jgi:hypothetical protein
MPNRNAVDEREKYDHSGHSTLRRQEGDLKAPGNESSPVPTRGNARGDARANDKIRATRPTPRPR